MLHVMHYTWQYLAEVMMVSRSTLWIRLTELGIPFLTLSIITNTELDRVVKLLELWCCDYIGALKSMNIP